MIGGIMAHQRKLCRIVHDEWDRLADGEGRMLVALIAAGTALRLIWLASIHGGIATGLSAAEASNVALAFARSGELADAYFAGQGPTAHLMPLHPTIAGGILWLFGPSSAPAHLVLLAWSLVQAICGYLAMASVMRRIGIDAATVRMGLALLLLVPPFVPQEVVDFRYWEGGGAALLAALNLRLMVTVADRDRLDLRLTAAAALLSAPAFFVSPPVGLAVNAAWAWLVLRRFPLVQALRFAAICASALGLLITPWVLRNQQAVGAPVLTRSNFGIELALANHDAARTPRSPAHAFHARLGEIHPAASATARQAVEAQGEIAYSKRLSTQGWAWMRDRPADALVLGARHITEFLFPRPWQMYFTGWEGMRGARAVTISLVHLLGLAGLIVGLWRRRRHFDLLAVYIAALTLPMAMFQPMPRYSFLLWALLAMLAVDFLRQSRVATAGKER